MTLRECFLFDRYRFYQYIIIAIFPLIWTIALFPEFVSLRWLTGCALGGLCAGFVYTIFAFICRVHQRSKNVRSQAVARGFIYTVLGGPLMFVVAVFLDWILGFWLWIPVALVILTAVILRVLYYIVDRTDAAEKKKRERDLQEAKEKNRSNRQEKFKLYVAELGLTFGFSEDLFELQLDNLQDAYLGHIVLFKNRNNYGRFRPMIFLRLRVLAQAASMTSQAEEDYKASFKGDGVIDLTTYDAHIETARIFTDAANAVRALGFVDCQSYWRDFLIKAYQEDEQAQAEKALDRRQKDAMQSA